ncbi:MAG: hypothetical protein ACM3XO_21620 [Bacteroidota bacterium]|jgi:hypothetical protein
MFRNQMVRRILYSFLIGFVLSVAITEIPFVFLQEKARPPKEITLVIPKGTADEVARGEQPPGIPPNMSFVVGDTLIVENQDSVNHQLGPLWIPAHASAKMSLDQVESLAYECSFQPTKYLGLDVNEPLTLGTRVFGVLYIALPLGILFSLYSLAIVSKKKEDVPA